MLGVLLELLCNLLSNNKSLLEHAISPEDVRQLVTAFADRNSETGYLKMLSCLCTSGPAQPLAPLADRTAVPSKQVGTCSTLFDCRTAGCIQEHTDLLRVCCGVCLFVHGGNQSLIVREVLGNATVFAAVGVSLTVRPHTPGGVDGAGVGGGGAATAGQSPVNNVVSPAPAGPTSPLLAKYKEGRRKKLPPPPPPTTPSSSLESASSQTRAVVDGVAEIGVDGDAGASGSLVPPRRQYCGVQVCVLFHR
jgi:hypothetical protein